jgi:hypothetical protein
LSPRQRLSDATDVHCSGSPLMTYWIFYPTVFFKHM